MADFARNLTILSPLMKDRDKLETKDVIGQELSLTDFDIVDVGKGAYGVCVFAEYPNKFLFAGTVLTDLLIKMYEKYGEDGKEELRTCGGMKLRLTTETAKEKNEKTGMKSQYTAVEIL
jgi:hypothetical protein